MKLETPVDCYQMIADDVYQNAPDGWHHIEIVYRLINGEELSAHASYKCMDVDGNVLMYMPTSSSSYAFKELSRLTSTPAKGLFKKCTFWMNFEGDFNVDFEYEDQT